MAEAPDYFQSAQDNTAGANRMRAAAVQPHSAADPYGHATAVIEDARQAGKPITADHFMTWYGGLSSDMHNALQAQLAKPRAGIEDNPVETRKRADRLAAERIV